MYFNKREDKEWPKGKRLHLDWSKDKGEASRNCNLRTWSEVCAPQSQSTITHQSVMKYPSMLGKIKIEN